jgi:hypothetical protein
MYGGKRVRPGVYEAVPGLYLRVVVLAELPRTRSTLLLRLLGARRVLVGALEDLDALPGDAWERSIATPILVQFGRATRGKPQTNEEDDVSTAIQTWFEDYQQELRDEGLRAGRDEGLRAGRDEGLRAGRDEGRAEEAARSVLTVLRVRGVAVPDGARERILAQKDPSLLERWLEKAAVAGSVADVIGEPS